MARWRDLHSRRLAGGGQPAWSAALGMVLELLMLATRTTWTPSMQSLPTDKLHVSRHACESGSRRIHSDTCRPLIVRLGDGPKDYTMSLHHP